LSRVYLTESIVGLFAYDEEGKLIASRPSPRRLDELVEYVISLERGEETPLHSEILSEIKEKGFKEVVVETLGTAGIVSKYGLTPIVQSNHLGCRLLRENIAKIAVETGFAKDEEDYYTKLHETMLEATRRKLRKEAQKRDLLAVQSIRAIDDIDKTINLFVARLREWYSIHFPELDEEVEDHEKYVKIVYEIGDRDSFTVDKLLEIGFDKGKAESIVNKTKTSIGAELSDFDINNIKTLAGIIVQLYELKRTLENYVDAVMKEVAPNITILVGPKLGARLLSLAGGLEELAKCPASTIQVLGAEKALFRALRTGSKPPKHGVIFQWPYIHKSPKWQRGKIARALATKLSIAAKIDYFTGRIVGDKLLDDLKKRIEEIKTLYPKPPKKEERPGRGRKR